LFPCRISIDGGLSKKDANFDSSGSGSYSLGIGGANIPSA
jgi:hypothetical protein